MGRHARRVERRAVGAAAPARRGTICPHGIRPIRPVIGAFNDGNARASSNASCKAWRRISATAANSICRKPSSTPASARRKKGLRHRPYSRGKGSKIMAISDRHGLPLAVHVASASPHEVTLVDATLAASFLDTLPARLIGDRGYDSDRLISTCGDLRDRDDREASPNRRVPTQDRRPLRRARRRWKVERLFAWLHNYRRIVTRWERHPANFLGMIHSPRP